MKNKVIKEVLEEVYRYNKEVKNNSKKMHLTDEQENAFNEINKSLNNSGLTLTGQPVFV